MWGWVDGQGRGTLHRLPPRFTSRDYLQLLRDEFLPAIQRLRGTPVHFQQDFSPVHRARIVREWLEEVEDLQLVPWVARAPDLSPIENVRGRTTDQLTPPCATAGSPPTSSGSWCRRRGRPSRRITAGDWPTLCRPASGRRWPPVDSGPATNPVVDDARRTW